MIAAIVATAKNNVIGTKNDLPWYLPADLKHFKDVTSGHVVIMGRKTYESIAARLGHGLPNRTNIVITRETDYEAEGCTVVHSIEDALARAGELDAFFIGGAEIYAQSLPFLDRLYKTEVEVEIEGDAFFPQITMNEWKEVAREHHAGDDRNPYDYTFLTLDRIR